MLTKFVKNIMVIAITFFTHALMAQEGHFHVTLKNSAKILIRFSYEENGEIRFCQEDGFDFYTAKVKHPIRAHNLNSAFFVVDEMLFGDGSASHTVFRTTDFTDINEFFASIFEQAQDMHAGISKIHCLKCECIRKNAGK